MATKDIMEIIAQDLYEAKKRGQTYNQMYKEAFEKGKERGSINKEALKAYRVPELVSPKEVSQIYKENSKFIDQQIKEREERDSKRKKMAKGGAVKKEEPKKKAEPMSPALLRAMKRYQEEEARRKMGERYDAIMPSPEPGEAKPKGMAKGGMTAKQQAKVGTVMKEFKAGSLHSGKGGKVVKNPKQAVAIAMSEARKKKA